jgi:hypothetical protein
METINESVSVGRAEREFAAAVKDVLGRATADLHRLAHGNKFGGFFSQNKCTQTCTQTNHETDEVCSGRADLNRRPPAPKAIQGEEKPQ